MDYEELTDELNDAFVRWCDDNRCTYTKEQSERFTEMAEQRIEEIMTGGLDMDEAYEMYQEEINDDIEYLMRG